MARIAGVDLPRNKRIEIALTYIYGLGRKAANVVLNQAGISPDKKSDDLDENDVRRIRDAIEANFRVEGDLRRDVQLNIKRLIDLQSYRGGRHRRNLPVRGQRTHTNARTRKGPRRMAVKKMGAVTKK
ncbi:MAG: 30S ribosomal protein S13 [Deltaproteobacteria bacterium]|nr:30S ribosomal protein S13 [Deltaproteobacteria bacterium]MCW5805835.1 30S ribosomal protein S13 [Deltaproteobacteria bacterium]